MCCLSRCLVICDGVNVSLVSSYFRFITKLGQNQKHKILSISRRTSTIRQAPRR